MKFKDRNSSFFHKYASQRKRKNQIHQLKKRLGLEISDPDEMESIAGQYFHILFTSNGVSDISRVLKGIEQCISNPMNEDLIAKYTQEEVVLTIKEIGPTKASREDGLPALFF